MQTNVLQDLTRQTKKVCLGWDSNMEQISDKPTEKNFEFMRRLKEDYPEKDHGCYNHGKFRRRMEELAKMCDQAGADLIEGNFSCPQMTSHAMGSDVGSTPELVKTVLQSGYFRYKDSVHR